MALLAFTKTAIPTAATETDLVTAAHLNAAQVFSNGVLYVSNQGAATTIRVRILPVGESLGSQHYILKDVQLEANDTQIIPIKALNDNDLLKVYSASGTVSFVLNGFLI